MGLLDSFEKGLERAVNSAFAKTFRSGIQPVEIASALRSELDKKAAVVSRDRILAPNTFTVMLSPADDEKMAALGGALGEELDTLVQKHAKAQGYSFAGPVSITLQRDDQLSTGTLRIESTTAQGRVSWRGVVDVEGRRHALVKSRTVIGRGSDADITICGCRHEPQARRDPVGRRARDGARHELHERHDPERPQGGRGRAASRLDRDDRSYRHRLPGGGAGGAAQTPDARR